MSGMHYNSFIHCYVAESGKIWQTKELTSFRIWGDFGQLLIILLYTHYSFSLFPI